MTDRTAIVSGSTGFIGEALCAALERHGWTVVGVARHAEGGRRRTEAIDLESQPGEFRALVESARPKVVFHLAMDRPGNFVEQSLERNRKMLNTVQAALSGVSAKLLIPGSAAQYGAPQDPDRPIAEDSPIEPVSSYGEVKVALEREALAGDPPPIWLRSFNTLGPGQPPGYPVADWIWRLVELEKSGGGVLKTGRLDLVRDYLDVRDLAEAYVAAIALEPSTVVNICSGTGIRLADLVGELLSLADCEVTLDDEPPDPTATVPLVAVGDPSRMQELTGWRPAYDIHQSLRDALACARETSLAG